MFSFPYAPVLMQCIGGTLSSAVSVADNGTQGFPSYRCVLLDRNRRRANRL